MTCGYITHEKGARKITGHKSFVSAVEHAKKASKTTIVMSVCETKKGRTTKVLARCANGGCGGSSLSGVGGKGRRAKRSSVRKRSKKRKK